MMTNRNSPFNSARISLPKNFNHGESSGTKPVVPEIQPASPEASPARLLQVQERSDRFYSARTHLSDPELSEIVIDSGIVPEVRVRVTENQGELKTRLDQEMDNFRKIIAENKPRAVGTAELIRRSAVFGAAYGLGVVPFAGGGNVVAHRASGSSIIKQIVGSPASAKDKILGYVVAPLQYTLGHNAGKEVFQPFVQYGIEHAASAIRERTLFPKEVRKLGFDALPTDKLEAVLNALPSVEVGDNGHLFPLSGIELEEIRKNARKTFGKLLDDFDVGSEQRAEIQGAMAGLGQGLRVLAQGPRVGLLNTLWACPTGVLGSGLGMVLCSLGMNTRQLALRAGNETFHLPVRQPQEDTTSWPVVRAEIAKNFTSEADPYRWTRPLAARYGILSWLNPLNQVINGGVRRLGAAVGGRKYLRDSRITAAAGMAAGQGANSYILMKVLGGLRLKVVGNESFWQDTAKALRLTRRSRNQRGVPGLQPPDLRPQGKRLQAPGLASCGAIVQDPLEQPIPRVLCQSGKVPAAKGLK